MAEFLFTGITKMCGVSFTINADTLEDAKCKASAGKYDDYDIGAAEIVDWRIDIDSGTENS